MSECKSCWERFQGYGLLCPECAKAADEYAKEIGVQRLSDALRINHSLVQFEPDPGGPVNGPTEWVHKKQYDG